MALHLRRASDADLEVLLARCRDDELSYSAVGVSITGPVPAGLTRRRWGTNLPLQATFDRARHALETWAVHRGAGLSVRTDGPLTVGTNVAMCAPMPIGFMDVTCRVVEIIDEDDRFGFAYGTLPTHPETGEESFTINRAPLRFAVEAVSQPVHPLARLAPRIADRLQAAAAERYLSAMSSASVP